MTPPRRRLAAVPEPTGTRAVAYLRVSAVMGREEMQSPDLQLRRIRDLIERRGLQQVDVVQDIDVSGRHFHREGIQRVLDMARSRPRRVDVVALYDLSRLGRNTGESLRVIAELREHGVTVVSTVEQIDDTPEGQFMLGQFLGMAQLYSDQIGRRWAETARYRVERGQYHGSNPPLGYLLVKGEGLVPDPETAPLMARVFDRYAAGHPISEIARDFNRGRGHGHSSAINILKGCLRKPVYAGRVTLNGQAYPGLHEPIVDQATWDLVQERLARDAVTPSRRLAVAYALTGLLLCDGCGYHLTHKAPARREAARGRTATVHCDRHAQFRDCPTGGVGTPQVRDLEAAVLDLVRRRLDDLRANPAARAARAAGRTRAAADVRRLGRELAETRTARGRLAADFARRVVDEGAYRLADRELADAETALIGALGDAETVASAGPARQAVAAGRWLLEHWDVMTAAERNRYLRALMPPLRLRKAAYYRQPVAERLEEPPGWRVSSTI